MALLWLVVLRAIIETNFRDIMAHRLSSLAKKKTASHRKDDRIAGRKVKEAEAVSYSAERESKVN